MIPFHARLNMCPHNLSIIYHVVRYGCALCGQSEVKPEAPGHGHGSSFADGSGRGKWTEKVGWSKWA